MLRVAHLTAVGFNSDEAVYSGQGAAMFGVGQADEYFSLFRAHPLLLQSIVGASFRVFGQSDFTARFIVAMLFGVGSVVLSYLIGRTLSGRVAGLAAAATCAVMPYHVIVSRQVLVDGAMGFFAALSLFLILRWMKTLSPRCCSARSRPRVSLRSRKKLRSSSSRFCSTRSGPKGVGAR